MVRINPAWGGGGGGGRGIDGRAPANLAPQRTPLNTRQPHSGSTPIEKITTDDWCLDKRSPICMLKLSPVFGSGVEFYLPSLSALEP